jgi:positive regulator of sigma E activity
VRFDLNKEDMLKRVYLFYFFPFFTGLIAALAPDWSARWGIIWILISLISWGVARLGRAKMAHRNPRWRIGYMICQMDIAALLAAAPLWRETGEKGWVAVMILLFYGACAYLSHRFRKIIMRELISPKTKIGLLLLAVGVIGGGAAGGFAYNLGDQLDRMFGDSQANIILAILLILGCAFLMIVFHAMWVKVDNSNWKAE